MFVGSRSGIAGNTISSSNVRFSIDDLNVTSGRLIRVATTGSLTIEPFGNSFTDYTPSTNTIVGFSTATGWSFNENTQTLTGLTIGKPLNISNVTIGSTTTIAGPITAYGGTIAINENISSSNGSTISLFGNVLTFGTNKTVTSNNGLLIIAPQTASNSIGLGGASGTLSLPSSYFSTNFVDGFSNIQIGSNTQTGAIYSNAFTLRDNLTLLTSGSLTLGGKPILGNNNVTLGSDITTINVGSPANYFQTNGSGAVIRRIANNSNLLFPVGNAAYNPISINNKTGITDTFSANVLDTAYLNGTSSGLIKNPHVKRTWNISKSTPSANAGSGVDLSFTWNANEIVGTLTNPTLNHHNGSGWEIPLMGTSSVSGNTLTYTGYKGSFSPFAIGGSSTVVLPVELLSFNTKCFSDYNQINWTTASEVNNKEFELYKSLDAIEWQKIYTVNGQGTKATESNYHFNDLEKQSSYYRLKDIDFDGKETWSHIISSECNLENTKTAIYPNPAKDFIEIITPWEENTTYRIVNLSGVVLYEGILMTNKSKISINELNAGIYIVEIEKKGALERLKFIKQ
jgi:hypothetical protein